MSWVKEAQYRWYETFAMNIIKSGPIPRHIAFIMDGNRRFARLSHIDKIDGHSRGFDKLSQCLRWCLDIGVKEVTTFAFSIENFKRSPDEVSELMDLAAEKFEKLLQEEDSLREKGVRIRVIGNISLLSLELQKLIAKAMLVTEENDKLFLNIAFAYTSREEITNSIQSILQDCGEDLQPEDINQELIRRCLYSNDSIEPDLLIRTSGETRISDFLMWQISSTVLYFTKTLWPAITLWHFLFGVFTYQRAQLGLFGFKQIELQQQRKSSEVFPERVQNFLLRVNASRRDFLVNLANAKRKDN